MDNEPITFFAVAPRPRGDIGIDEEMTAFLHRRITSALGQDGNIDAAAGVLRVAPWRLAQWMELLDIRVGKMGSDK